MFFKCLSVHNRPHGYSFTAWPYGAVGMQPTGMLSCFCCEYIFSLFNNSSVFFK